MVRQKSVASATPKRLHLWLNANQIQIVNLAILDGCNGFDYPFVRAKFVAHSYNLIKRESFSLHNLVPIIAAVFL